MKTTLPLLLMSVCGVAQACTIADYHFDGNLLDSSGNGFHATPHGPVSYDAGSIFFNNPSGNAPATHWIELPLGVSQRMSSGTFSIAITLRTTDSSRNGGRLFGGGNVPQVALAYNAQESNGAYYQVIDDDGDITTWFGNNGSIADGRLHTMTLAFDGPRALAEMFRDGESMGQREIAGYNALSIGVLTLGTINGQQSGYGARATYVDRVIVTDAVPEPQTFLALALGAAGLLGRRKQSKQL